MYVCWVCGGDVASVRDVHGKETMLCVQTRKHATHACYAWMCQRVQRVLFLLRAACAKGYRGSYSFMCASVKGYNRSFFWRAACVKGYQGSFFCVLHVSKETEGVASVDTQERGLIVEFGALRLCLMQTSMC